MEPIYSKPKISIARENDANIEKANATVRATRKAEYGDKISWMKSIKILMFGKERINL
ncbi:MAG: hypothetical protein CM15mV128_160 [Caudoviricetes sp.]|nr:MAG: hypothetical protein CM15mV128_160 [Caudoviricetes sp.]